MSLLNPFPHAFGIYITNYRIRFINLERRRSFTGRPFIALRSFNQVELPEGLVKDGEIQDEKKLSGLIVSLLAGAFPRKETTRFVVTTLPEPKTFIKIIQIPWMSDEEIPQAVRWEIEKHLPFSIDEVNLDYKIMSSEQNENRISILVGAAERKVIQSYQRTLKMAGLIPIAVEIEAIAIARDLIDESLPDKAILIIDIGRSRTNLILFAQGGVQFTTSVKFSGENIIQNIMDKLGVNRTEAVKLRDLCGVDPRRCKGELKKIVSGSFDQLFNQIDTVLQFYQDHVSSANLPEKILLTGSSSQIAGLESIIKEQAKIPAEMIDPIKKISLPDNPQIKKKMDDIVSGLATAMGLALRGLKSDQYDE